MHWHNYILFYFLTIKYQYSAFDALSREIKRYCISISPGQTKTRVENNLKLKNGNPRIFSKSLFSGLKLWGCVTTYDLQKLGHTSDSGIA